MLDLWDLDRWNRHEKQKRCAFGEYTLDIQKKNVFGEYKYSLDNQKKQVKKL